MKKLFDNTAEYRHRCRAVIERMYPTGYIGNDYQFFYYYDNNMYRCVDVYTHAEYIFNLETGKWDMTLQPSAYYEQADALCNFMTYIASIAPDEVAKSIAIEMASDVNDDERNDDDGYEPIVDCPEEYDEYEEYGVYFNRDRNSIPKTTNAITINTNPDPDDVQTALKNTIKQDRLESCANVFLRIMLGINKNNYKHAWMDSQVMETMNGPMKRHAVKTGELILDNTPIFDDEEFKHMMHIANIDYSQSDPEKIKRWKCRCKLQGLYVLKRFLEDYTDRQNQFSPKNNSGESGCRS